MNESTTPNPTAEQILVDEWIRQADRAKSMTGMDAIWFPDAEETLAALRAHGLLSEGAPTEEQIEKAARAFFREYHGEDIWPELRDDGELDTRSRALAATRVALTAAGVAPQPVVDEAALAEVIADAPHSGDPNVSCLDPRCKAAAVAAWLREGVAPQEPSQTETKSGNNFVSLDPEKVADVIGAAQVIREVGEDGRTSISFASGETIARALCEAYTEGKLTK